MLQRATIKRLVRVPIDLQFAFTLSDIEASKDKAMKKVSYDMCLIVWDLILFSVRFINY